MCAKKAGNVFDLVLNAVSMEEDLTGVDMNVEQEVFEVTCAGDAAETLLVGLPKHSLELSGFPDYASGRSDATLYALVGSAGVTQGFDPTGATAGPNDPNYDSTVVLANYKISAKVGSPQSMTASLRGTGALTRAVA